MTDEQNAVCFASINPYRTPKHNSKCVTNIECEFGTKLKFHIAKEIVIIL